MLLEEIGYLKKWVTGEIKQRRVLGPFFTHRGRFLYSDVLIRSPQLALAKYLIHHDSYK